MSTKTLVRSTHAAVQSCLACSNAVARRTSYARVGGSRCTRWFSMSARRRTDGVYKELTAMRVPIPWIEAFKKRQAQQGQEQEQEQEQGSIGSSASPKTDSSADAPAERKLIPKRMKDSYHRVILPLARDPWLSDTYLNASGHIRLGTLMMDLDAMSGVVAYKHTGDTVTTVTAAFDRITLNNPLTEICDLEISGEVTYTGSSSMEISLQVARYEEGKELRDEDVMISCSCTMVSLDPVTKKPTKINPLIIETPTEKKLFARGQQNSLHRKSQKHSSLVHHTPNDLESDLIHALWKQQLQWHDPNNPLRKPPSTHWMADTILRTAAIMQPQYRNRHHFMVFGGYLLKSAFELAFCCAASFSHKRPNFVSLDPSMFLNPVPVGSVLYLTATVTYTEPVGGASEANEGSLASDSSSTPEGSSTSAAKGTRIQVRVDTKVRNVEHGETKPTGQFNYTFVVDEEIAVMPKSYTEFMMWVDARRRAGRVASLVEGMEKIALRSVTE